VKALILSGGSGTRLRPITHTSSKQLVPVANKPILFHAIEHMADAGITDVGIVVGDTAEEIESAVGDGSAFGVSITYIRQDAPLGLAHCVLIASEFLGDDNFIMYLGDNLLRQGVTKFVERFDSNAQILLARVPDPQRFGVAELDGDGNVVRLVEKPLEPPSNLALVGAYIFDKNIHEAVRAIQPSARGELEITDAIQWLIDSKLQVQSDIVEGYWKDLGELRALLDGNSLVLETLDFEVLGSVTDSEIDQRVRIEEGAEVSGSRLRGPAIIGKRARVINSFVGPFTSIGDDCEIVDSEIEHSMFLKGATANGVGRIADSLVGRDASVVRNESRERTTRLMIGDHSKVELR
jgi:glucose-1-phosphate thymidylyltransferase